jgi:hypothetical protein
LSFKSPFMIPLLIGISSGILIIGLFRVLKGFDKRAMYSLILVGIGFLYVGFTWSDRSSFIICSVQALLFLYLAYRGIKKSYLIIAIGYFLHGTWDIVYGIIENTNLIPPGYDLFCSSLDYVIGIYLIACSKQIQSAQRQD